MHNKVSRLDKDCVWGQGRQHGCAQECLRDRALRCPDGPWEEEEGRHGARGQCSLQRPEQSHNALGRGRGLGLLPNCCRPRGEGCCGRLALRLLSEEMPSQGGPGWQD